MTDFVNTAINAAKVPLFSVAIPLVVGAVIVAESNPEDLRWPKCA